MMRGPAILLILVTLIDCGLSADKPSTAVAGSEIFVGTPKDLEKWPFRYTMVRSGEAWSGEIEYVQEGDGIYFATIQPEKPKESKLVFDAPFGGPGKAFPLRWELKMTASKSGYEGVLVAIGVEGLEPVALSFVLSPDAVMPSTLLDGKIKAMDVAVYRSDVRLQQEIQMAKTQWNREQEVALRLAELRSDDPLRGGVYREWMGPYWVKERLEAESLKYFERIHCVYLGGTKVTDKDVEALETLAELRELYLHRTDVTDACLKSIGKLASLQVLHLRNTRVTDQGVDLLKSLSNLQELYLIETGVTEEGVKRLREALPNTTIFR